MFGRFLLTLFFVVRLESNGEQFEKVWPFLIAGQLPELSYVSATSQHLQLLLVDYNNLVGVVLRLRELLISQELFNA